MESRTPAPASDRGAILVHTALAILALVAFTTFVVDYGTLWLSRREAQNAADAGALAGALSLANEGATDFSTTGPARMNGEHVAKKHRVFGQVPNVNIATDVNILCQDSSKCPVGPCPDGSNNTCIRVDVYRNQARGNPLPMFFGTLVGLTAQGIRATATAQVGGANAARCMLPFVLADRWADNFDEFIDPAFAGDNKVGVDGWTNSDLYQEPQGDSYIPPYHPGHTGWTVTGDFGRQLVLHPAVNQFSAGWANVVNLPGMGSGGDPFRESIRGCSPDSPTVGIAAENEDCSAYTNPSGTTVEEALAGCLGSETGGMQGPTKQGVEDNGGGPSPWPPLVDQDVAFWSDAVNGGPPGTTGGVVDGAGNLNMDSPRIRPVPVFDIDQYMSNTGCNNLGGSGCVAKVVNIIGVFVEGLCDTVQAAGKLVPGNTCKDGPGEHPDSQVVIRIVTMPGKYRGGNGTPVDESVFLKYVSLIR